MACNSLLVLLLLVAAASAAVPVFNGDAKEKVEADSADGNDDAVLVVEGSAAAAGLYLFLRDGRDKADQLVFHLVHTNNDEEDLEVCCRDK